MSSATATLGNSSNHSYYYYSPSSTLPIVYASLFFISLLIHTIFSLRTRICRNPKHLGYIYMAPFVTAIAGEVVAYVTRCISARWPEGNRGLTLAEASELCTILSPAFLTATLSILLGRMTHYVDPSLTPLGSDWITEILVAIDILSFSFQAAGAGMYALTNVSENQWKLGKGLLTTGFVLQVLGLFVLITVGRIFEVRALSIGIPTRRWRKLLWIMYAAGSLIILRSVYRIVEFITANFSRSAYLQTHEAFFYVFESTPILISCSLFFLQHPTTFLPRDKFQRMEGHQSLPTSSPKTSMAEKRIKPGPNTGKEPLLHRNDRIYTPLPSPYHYYISPDMPLPLSEDNEIFSDRDITDGESLTVIEEVDETEDR